MFTVHEYCLGGVQSKPRTVYVYMNIVQDVYNLNLEVCTLYMNIVQDVYKLNLELCTLYTNIV